MWAKPVSDGSVAVVLFNRTGEDQDIQAQAGEVGLPDAAGYRSRGLWTGVETSIGSEIRASVSSHGAVVYRVWPIPGRGVLAALSSLIPRRR
ncbi:hypothetical protein AB0H34_36910 [Saccharopolyspora shandongensis]|uniref:hypothetical protein n=1 Tax=Saccharopolyspora shandongensis TaxID=418495 RepID=UPI0033F7564A